MNNKTLFTILTLFVLVAGGLAVKYGKANTSQPASPELTAFAQCITDSGAKFYGAFWCPHCNDQKRAFGGAVDLIPYIECSTPDKRSQVQVCKDAGITGYPTWTFSNGEQLSGNQTLARLAEATACELPAEVN